MLVTIYHKMFTWAHNHAVDDRVITWWTIARSRDLRLCDNLIGVYCGWKVHFDNAFPKCVWHVCLSKYVKARASRRTHDGITWSNDSCNCSYVARHLSITHTLARHFPRHFEVHKCCRIENKYNILRGKIFQESVAAARYSVQQSVFHLEAALTTVPGAFSIWAEFCTVLLSE